MLGAAVALWVAGFDFFYALFDEEIDRARGAPLDRDALRRARRVPRRPARSCGTVACLVAAGLGLPVGVLYWLGVVAVAVLLAYEHSLVRPTDLRRLDTAFFTMNGVISVVFAAFVILDAAVSEEGRRGRRPSSLAGAAIPAASAADGTSGPSGGIPLPSCSSRSLPTRTLRWDRTWRRPTRRGRRHGPLT